MANTSAIWQQVAHTTDQLSPPGCSTRAIQKSLILNEKYLSFLEKRPLSHRADTDLSFPVCSSICHKITQTGLWSAWPCDRHGSHTWCAYSVFSTKLTHTLGADVDLSRWPSCGAGGREWWVERGDWRPGDRDPELLSARYLKSPRSHYTSPQQPGICSTAHYSSQ